jgi:uncharacterized membrane protein YeaQ/YmgE (transglycosylase-associated protein family)
MKTLTLILLLSFTAKAQKDGTLKHNVAGQAIGMLSGWVAYKKTNKMWVGMLTSAVIAGTAGYLKEKVYDQVWHNGTYSEKDMLNTGWGGMVGAICLVPIMKQHQDRIYEAEQMCNDLKNPIFLRDSL